METNTSVDQEVYEPEISDDSKIDEDIFPDDKKKESKTKRKEKDPIEEIETICKRYIPNIDDVLGLKKIPD